MLVDNKDMCKQVSKFHLSKWRYSATQGSYREMKRTQQEQRVVCVVFDYQPQAMV